ncbi:methionyl-tRNA formyltransferase [bacterium]|nr:methionyl-tRNA formyltransferase [bacterium]
MRVVYMGTPQFAVPSLEILHQNFQVVAVVTQPDRPKGRGCKLTPPPVKLKAEELGLPVYQPLKVRDPEFLSILQDLNPDIILVAAYAKLIPPSILNLPRLGCVNLHPSLLPRHRGAIPVPAAIMAGDKVTGITTFLMGEGYDTGDILLQREVEIKSGESGSELLECLSHIGAEVLLETVLGLERGEIKPVPQIGEANYTKPLKGEDLVIDWSKSALEIVNFVRALYSEPEATTSLRDQVLKIGKAEVAEGFGEELLQTRPGQVLALLKGRGPVVAAGGGAVLLQYVKPAGKGWMDGKSFMTGRRISVGDVLG